MHSATEPIDMFHIILTTNTSCSPAHHYLIGSCKGGGACWLYSPIRFNLVLKKVSGRHQPLVY